MWKGLGDMNKQQKNEHTETQQIENDFQSFFEGLNEYLKSQKAESTFLDSFCSACDKYTKAVNSYPKDDTEKNKKRELLEGALKDAESCRDIHDRFSQSINPNGLIMVIKNEISELE